VERALFHLGGPRGGEAFDGEDVVSLGFEGGKDAGVDGLAIDEDGADAALGFVAADFGAGEAQVVAEHFGQEAGLGDVQFYRVAVDGHF
jgi:hypothetical protein